MNRPRVSSTSLQESAEAGLRSALEDLGMSVVAPSQGRDVDLEVTLPDGRTVLIDVKAAAVPTMSQLRHTLEALEPGQVVVVVVVADQISRSLRQEIESAGAGWLDRRGHLKLAAPGLWIDADVPALPRPGARPAGAGAIRGRSGLAAASAMLLHPDRPPGPSEVARASDLNPSSISRAMASLAEHHLADKVGRGSYRPLIPELFWALADAWPRETEVVRWQGLLGESDPLGLWDPGEEPGCALAGVRGAVAWGVPVVATADYPLHVYSPSEDLIRRAKILNEGGQGAEVHFSVDPVGYVTSERYEGVDPHWRTAHPLFCALDLAGSSRDREALEGWDPPGGFVRVW